MVQNITSAFKPLQVEAADARLGKKKGEELEGTDDQGRKHQKNSDNTKEKEFSSLSVKALILFLEDFVEARLEAKLRSQENRSESDVMPWLKSAQSNDTERKAPSGDAARAYAQAAKTAPRKNMFRPQNKINIDLKHLYTLIQSLRALELEGVKYLSIDTSLEFLEAVNSAVQEKQSEIQQG